MGLDDKITNKADELGGKAKETAGDVTGNDHLKASGKNDQTKAKFADAADTAKEKAGDAFNRIKHVFSK